MGEIKMFRIAESGKTELAGEAMQVERSLQSLCEQNLDTLLGVRFLASEYSTGPVHGGRIDTLGIDENCCPVIIEFKRSINENVVNQGLFYLDWLMDHRRDFQWLVMEKYGNDVAKGVDWSGPRLLCIAGDFTKYDEHAVKQIARNIELLRYKRFGQELFMLELVHAPKQARRVNAIIGEDQPDLTSIASEGVKAIDQYQSYRLEYRLSQADQKLRDIYEAVRDYLTALGDDVQTKELSLYLAFKRIKNFACLEIYPKAKTVLIHLKVDPLNVEIEDGFTRNMTGVGHYGTGDLQVVMRTMDDFVRPQPLFMRSYQES